MWMEALEARDTIAAGSARFVSEPLIILSEERWIRAAQRGDVEAFNSLVDAYQNVAYSVALRTLGHPEDAADATQEAFVSAFRSMSSFRGGSFKSWLIRIVVNACYDMRRYSRRRPSTSLDGIVDDAGEAPWVDDQTPNPEDVALSTEARATIERALAQLPEEQRMAIVLVDMQGLSYEEAAGALGCAVGTVRSRLARGRARARDELRLLGTQGDREASTL
jgi:RNA polymerase sigma-70 factor (ECF subfamily)